MADSATSDSSSSNAGTASQPVRSAPAAGVTRTAPTTSSADATGGHTAVQFVSKAPTANVTPIRPAAGEAVALGSIQSPTGPLINLTISNGEIRPCTLPSQTLQTSLATLAVARDMRSAENSNATTVMPKPIIVTVSGIGGAAPFSRPQLTAVTPVSPGPILAGSIQTASTHSLTLQGKLANSATTMNFIATQPRSLASFTPSASPGMQLTSTAVVQQQKPAAAIISSPLVPATSSLPIVFATPPQMSDAPFKPSTVVAPLSTSPVTMAAASKPRVVSKVTVPVQTDESGTDGLMDSASATQTDPPGDGAAAGTNPAALDPTNPDYDPIQALDWKDGIATLPGSNIKFRLNEFGTLEVLDSEDPKPAAGKTKKEQEDAKGGEHPEEPPAKQQKVDSKLDGRNEICKCENCGAHGIKNEFVQGRFCSQPCYQIHNKKTVVLKKHKEMLLMKKKRKRLGLHYMSAVDGSSKDIKYTVKDKSDKNSVKLVMNASKVVPRSKSFLWASYLEEQKATAAPAQLFKEHQLFPASKNGFKPGMKLEGIDPKHPSMFCVLTVMEVLGPRIRLHFDGYSDCYDFWVNADSTEIFPVGWCEKTGHKLHPPKGYTSQSFHWPSYLRTSKAQAAPKHLFTCRNTQHVTPHGFRVGMKLEAVDKKNSSLVCVATVADVMDNRFLVHFDGWDDIYDYWADPMSPYIHPVNWCLETGHVLTPPNNYKNPETFTWERYLAETKTQAVPARAFKQKVPHGFKVGMKLEAVDKRNPKLIRVATIADTEPHMVKVHFDGWSDVYDYWVDHDSPDLHPVSWCMKTRHPLEPPINMTSSAAQESGCPTPGCKGIGHIKGPKYTSHHSAFGCPYSPANMNKETTLLDRLGASRENGSESAVKNESGSHQTAAEPNTKKSGSCDVPSGGKVSKMGYRMVERYLGKGSSMANGDDGYPPPKRKRGRPATSEAEDKESARSEDGDSTRSSSQSCSLQDSVHRSVFVGNPVPNPSREMPLCWDHHSKLLPGVSRIKGNTVAKWSIDDVANFIDTIPGCQDQSRLFKEEQIDGEAFLLLNQTDIVKILSIKLGPALKIYNSILMFRSTLTD